jgi:hypothetical protein
VKDIWPWKQEGTVNITIYDVPEGLLREFVEKVINPDYQAESAQQSKT